MTDRRRARPERPLSDDPEEKRSADDGQHERDDEAARKRAQLEVLRRIREVGWWWSDGS